MGAAIILYVGVLAPVYALLILSGFRVKERILRHPAAPPNTTIRPPSRTVVYFEWQPFSPQKLDPVISLSSLLLASAWAGFLLLAAAVTLMGLAGLGLAALFDWERQTTLTVTGAIGVVVAIGGTVFYIREGFQDE